MFFKFMGLFVFHGILQKKMGMSMTQAACMRLLVYEALSY